MPVSKDEIDPNPPSEFRNPKSQIRINPSNPSNQRPIPHLVDIYLLNQRYPRDTFEIAFLHKGDT
jgi:hypothetical protein